MFESPRKPILSSAQSSGESSGEDQARPEVTDLAELTARFSAHGGGAVSPELSAELALEIIFNEIVQQACLATGATGAAIALKRNGEIVCRASSGSTAPELGARLDGESGLSGACLRTRQPQHCDDAQTDPRADGEASRRLDVHAVMVVPLLHVGDIVGVFEVFSSRVAAFGERDQRTLEALAQRVIRNLIRAQEPIPRSVEISAVPAPAGNNGRVGVESAGHAEVPAVETHGVETHGVEKMEEGTPRRGTDVVTGALALVVLAATALLGVLLGQRLGWPRTGAPVQSSRTSSGAASDTPSGHPPDGQIGPGAVSAAPPSTPTASMPSSARRPAAAGSDLLVYENGKEVFRMPSAHEPAPVEPASVVDVSPAAAEEGLLHRVEPDYPEQARARQIQGPVVVDLRIGPEGTVQDLKPVSGQPLLVQAAVDALKQWRFKPYERNGKQLEMQTRITLNFRLPR